MTAVAAGQGLLTSVGLQRPSFAQLGRHDKNLTAKKQNKALSTASQLLICFVDEGPSHQVARACAGCVTVRVWICTFAGPCGQWDGERACQTFAWELSQIPRCYRLIWTPPCFLGTAVLMPPPPRTISTSSAQHAQAGSRVKLKMPCWFFGGGVLVFVLEHSLSLFFRKGS